MTDPSNMEEELFELRKRIKHRLNMEADRILREEIENILGRVKIFVEVGLRDGQYAWFIDARKWEEKEK